MTEFSFALNKYLHELMWETRKKSFIGIVEKANPILEYEWGYSNFILKIMNFNFVHAETINPYFRVDLDRIHNGVKTIASENFRKGFDDAYYTLMTFFQNYNKNILLNQALLDQEKKTKTNIRLVVNNETINDT